LPDRAPFGGNILGKVIDRVGDTAGDAVDVGSMAIDSVPLPDRPLFGDKVVKVISAPEITAISTLKQIERADATAERAADTIDVGSMAIDSVPLPDRAPFGGNILGKVIDRVGDTAGDAPNEGLNISINNWLLDHGDTIV